MTKIKSITWAQYGQYYVMPNQIVPLKNCKLKQLQAVYDQKEQLYTNQGWHEESLIRNKPLRFDKAYLAGPAGQVILTPPEQPAPLVGNLESIKNADPCCTRRELFTVYANDWIKFQDCLLETETQHNLRVVVENEKSSIKAWDPIANKMRNVQVIDVPIVFAHGSWVAAKSYAKEYWLYENTPKNANWWIWNATACAVSYSAKCDKNAWLTCESTCVTVQEVESQLLNKQNWAEFNEKICLNFARAKMLACVPDRRLDFAVL